MLLVLNSDIFAKKLLTHLFFLFFRGSRSLSTSLTRSSRGSPGLDDGLWTSLHLRVLHGESLRGGFDKVDGHQLAIWLVHQLDRIAQWESEVLYYVSLDSTAGDRGGRRIKNIRTSTNV